MTPQGTAGPVPLLLGSGWFPDTPGGLNRYLYDLTNALRHLGGSPKATLIGPALDAPIDITAASSASRPLLLRLLQYWIAAERSGPGASLVDVHFVLYAFLPVVVGRLRGLPLVVHFHGPWADESAVAGTEPGVAIGIKRYLERRTYRRASVAVTMSTAFKRILVEHYGVMPWRVRVIHPGVDLNRFRPGDRTQARVRIGVPGTGPIVATVRRLNPRMGLDVLLDAWVQVQGKLPEARLLVVGDGAERRQLEALAMRKGIESSVIFLGRVGDETLVDCYRAADVTVVPTTVLEGFGLVVLESLACGRPVVVTDAGGLPESVTGLEPTTIVSPGDPTALAGGLVKCLTDPTATPSPDRCRTYAEAHGWNDVARRHVRIYADAVEPPTGPPRLRVVYLDHCAQLSGGELALLTLLTEMRNVDTHVILGEEGPLVAQFLRRDISVEVLPLAAVAGKVKRDRVRPGSVSSRSIGASVAYILRLARRLHRLRPDIVHTNSLKAALYGGVAARLVGLPVVWHIRDRIAPDYLPAAGVRLVRAMAGRVPQRIVANSRTTLATLGPAGANGRVIASPVRLPSGLDPLRQDRPDTALRVGMLGRLAPWKGQHLFLDAFAAAFPRGRELAVVVGGSLFGEDEYGASLQSRATSLGLEDRVEFRGFRDDVMVELRTMDIVVHASIVPEPFGQVIVEAMAAGVPVIAADAGGPAEIVTDGIDGLLYPPGDVPALANSMRTLADDPVLRDRLQCAARRRARDFAPERVASQVMDVYRSMVATRRRP